LLLAVVLAQVWFPRLNFSQTNDTYSVELGGRNLLYQLIQRHEDYAGRNTARLADFLLDAVPLDTVFCIIGPPRAPRPDEWEALLNWAARGGIVVYAHPYGADGVELKALGVRIVRLAADEGGAVDDRAELNKTIGSVRMLSKVRLGPYFPEEAFQDRGPFPWRSQSRIDLRDPNVGILVHDVNESIRQAVRVEYGEGAVVVVATDDPFSNEALSMSPETAGLVLSLSTGAKTAPDEIRYVVFDEHLNATGLPRVVSVLLDPLLRPITLQCVALVVLFGWAGSRRFGPFLPRLDPPRHNIADHTDALGTWYYRVGNGSGAVAAYLGQMRHDLQLTGDSATLQRRLAPIAARMSVPLATVTKLWADATAAARTPNLSKRSASQLIDQLAAVRQAALSRSDSGRDRRRDSGRG
jgi:hypothetical protein